MDQITEIPVVLANGIGVVGVCLIVAWLVWSGRLIPKATHDREVGYLTQRIEDEQHEKTEWRTESRVKDQQILELSDQNRAMLTAFGPTLSDFLRSLRSVVTSQLSRQAIEDLGSGGE